MGRPGGPGPLDPIFDVPTQTGVLAFNNTPGATSLRVTINQAAGQDDPALLLPILFTAVFSRAVTGFTSSDVTLGGTADPLSCTVTEVAPLDGTTFQVSVNTTTLFTGTVSAAIPAGVCTAVDDGTLNSASTSTDNVVQYNGQPTLAAIVETFAGQATVDVAEVRDNLLVAITTSPNTFIYQLDITDPYNIVDYGVTIPRTNGSAWIGRLDDNTIVHPIGTNFSTSGIRSVNVTNPLVPVTLQDLLNPKLDPSTSGPRYDGTYLTVIASGPFDRPIVVMNVANPSSMSNVSSTAIGDFLNPAWIGQDARYVYEAVGNLRVIDCAAPTAPVSVGTVGLTQGQRAVALAMPDEVADFVAVMYQSGGGALEIGIVDVRTPSAPALAFTTLSTGGPGIYIRGTLFTFDATNCYLYDTSPLPSSNISLITSFAHGLGSAPNQVRYTSGPFVYLATNTGVAVMELNP